MGSIWDWSTTASNNGASDSGINFAEGMAAAAVNNSARALMARVAELLADAGGTVSTTGSSNAYLLTSTAGVTAYTDGQIFGFTANFTNSSTATLNVRSLGAKTIYAHGAALTGGEIVSGGVYLVIYDAALNTGTGGFHLMNPKPVAALFPASSITSSATGNISSTNVQAALAELDTEKQPIDATLTALAGVTTAANKLIYATASDTFTTTDLSAFARTFLDDADAATVRATLGLVIGTNVQAYNAFLADIASLGASVASGDLFYGNATNDMARLAKGTDGKGLLLSSGLPAWGYPGKLEYIATLTPSGVSSIDQTGLSAYCEIVLVFEGISTSTGCDLAIRTSADGSTFATSGYVGGQGRIAGTSGGNSANSSYIILQTPGAGADAQYGVATIIGLNNSNSMTMVHGVLYDANGSRASYFGGGYGTARAEQAIRLFLSAGTFDAGSVKVYGRKGG